MGDEEFSTLDHERLRVEQERLEFDRDHAERRLEFDKLEARARRRRDSWQSWITGLTLLIALASILASFLTVRASERAEFDRVIEQTQLQGRQEAQIAVLQNGASFCVDYVALYEEGALQRSQPHPFAIPGLSEMCDAITQQPATIEAQRSFVELLLAHPNASAGIVDAYKLIYSNDAWIDPLVHSLNIKT